MYLSYNVVFSNDYKRDWTMYGNQYAKNCPKNLSEREILGSVIKTSYIGNCKFGQKDNFGKRAFCFADFTKDYYFPKLHIYWISLESIGSIIIWLWFSFFRNKNMIYYLIVMEKNLLIIHFVLFLL